MPIKISAHLPDQLVRTVFLRDDDEILIGRTGEVQLQIPHASVSRQHARVFVENGQWFVEDLGSKNGIRLDGNKTIRGQLQDRTWFAVGDVFCQFEVLNPGALERLESKVRERRDSSVQLSRQMDLARTGDDMLQALLRGVVELSECRRGFVLTSPDGTSVKLQVAHAIDPDELSHHTFSGSRSAVERAITQRRPVFSSSASDQAFLKQQASVIREGIRALVCLPLVQNGRVMGVVYADTDEANKLFTELDAELLQAFAEQATNLLAVRQLDLKLQAFESWLDGNSASTDPGLHTTPSNLPHLQSDPKP